MSAAAIFGPFFAMFVLTFAVWLYMYVRRIRHIVGARISPAELAIPGELARRSPRAVSNPSDNLKNLFEIPVLFYALCLYLYVTNGIHANYVAAAWLFLFFC